MPPVRTVWCYFVSRDSNGGVLSDVCQLWWMKPLRVVHADRVWWVARELDEPGHLGEHPVKDIVHWFRTKPDTDLELIRVEQWSTEERSQGATRGTVTVRGKKS